MITSKYLGITISLFALSLFCKATTVNYYIENSGSIFGYINGKTEYNNVIAELANHPDFVKYHINQSFNFINGEKVVTHIGNNPNTLVAKLNLNGYNCGNTTTSNLNEMFKLALSKTSKDAISILISDGIYDVGGAQSPASALELACKSTRTNFLNAIQANDIQTIVIKLNSTFNGDYYFASKSGKQKLNQKRPYYIWIFGPTNLLTKFFSENYIKGLKGFEAHALFVKTGNSKIKFQPDTYKLTGNFKLDKGNKTILTNSKPNPAGILGFSIAVDYTDLPFPESYLMDLSNYEISKNYKVVEVIKNNNLTFGLPFNATHLIVVKSISGPFGNIEIKLKSTTPQWILATNATSEDNISRDSSHTYGFKELMEGISGAYSNMSPQNMNLATFNICVKN